MKKGFKRDSSFEGDTDFLPENHLAPAGNPVPGEYLLVVHMDWARHTCPLEHQPDHWLPEVGVKTAVVDIRLEAVAGSQATWQGDPLQDLVVQSREAHPFALPWGQISLAVLGLAGPGVVHTEKAGQTSLVGIRDQNCLGRQYS